MSSGLSDFKSYGGKSPHSRLCQSRVPRSKPCVTRRASPGRCDTLQCRCRATPSKATSCPSARVTMRYLACTEPAPSIPLVGEHGIPADGLGSRSTSFSKGLARNRRLSRFGRAVRHRAFGGARSPDLEEADKKGAVDDLKAEQDGGAGRNDKPRRLRVRERTKPLGAQVPSA